MLQAAGKDTVELYREAVNRHEVEEALSYLAEDFTLRFVGTDFEMSKSDARRALGWDAGANGHIEWEKVTGNAEHLTYEGKETNDFLQLIGIEELRFKTTFELDGDGQIREQLYELHLGQASPEEAMKPAVDWALRHRPSELHEIYPDGRLEYSEEMARRWVKLLREWKAATAP